MGYGIDSIYDPSDVSRMLAELREQRLQREEARTKKFKGAAIVGNKAWEIWSREQTAKTSELLDQGFKIDPRYTEKNWLSRSFTPASKRVIPGTTGTPDVPIEEPTSSATVVAKGDVAAKFGLKEAGAGIGAGMSLYETISNWDEYRGSKATGKRALDIGKTLAYTASSVPGPHQVISAPIAGALTLADWLWK
jgi:hypothetical protein